MVRARNPQGAIAAFEQVVALTPDQLPGARGAGRALRRRRRSTKRRRSRTTSSSSTPTSRARRRCARSASSTRAAGLANRARCCHELLALLGTATPAELALPPRLPPTPELKPDNPYAAPLDDKDREQHLAHDEATLMSNLLLPVGGGPGPHRPAAGGLRRLGARQGLADGRARPGQDLRPGGQGAGEQEDRALRPRRGARRTTSTSSSRRRPRWWSARRWPAKRPRRRRSASRSRAASS